MAKGSKRSGGKAAPGAHINKMESYEDTLEEGGVDDFMFKRDQINFDTRDDSDGEYYGNGDEVLALNVPKRGGSDEEDFDDGGDYDDEDGDEDEVLGRRRLRKEKKKVDHSARGRFGKDDSDSDDDLEGSDEDSGSESGSSDDDEEGWGRQYYSRPSTRREKERDDVYDEKRDEERELEEKEARRLQRKSREALEGAEDWGLDDVQVEHAILTKEEEEAPVAPVPVPETTDPAELLRHLQAHEPLKLALARDFPLVLRKLKKTARGIKTMCAEREGEESLHKGLGWLHYQTLLAYATNLAFYLYLCSMPTDERPDLSRHPILLRLLELKHGVAMLEDLDFAAGSVSDQGPELFVRPDMDDDMDEEEFAAMMAAKRELMARMNEASGKGLPDGEELGIEMDSDDEDEMDVDEDDDMHNLWHTAGLEDNELDDLIADQEPSAGEGKKKKRERGRKNKKAKEAKDAKESKKEAKSKKRSKKAAPVADDSDSDSDEPATAAAFTPMAEPEFVASKPKKSKKAKAAVADADETLGEASVLGEADAVDKERRTKSLRFHTSRIAATAARRSAARERRQGGDDDIPYRDRQAARDAALRKNAPRGDGGEDLDPDAEWTESDRKRAREVRDEAGADADEGEDGYYELVKRRKVAKQEAKEAAHEAFREDKFASFEDESADGPRALTRAIEKNRGLTPRRSKAGRNPRVKKRQAYEKAKQRVGSQRAVFKGGQAALSGSYSGEKTGISTAVKSRKF